MLRGYIPFLCYYGMEGNLTKINKEIRNRLEIIVATPEFGPIKMNRYSYVLNEGDKYWVMQIFVENFLMIFHEKVIMKE